VTHANIQEHHRNAALGMMGGAKLVPAAPRHPTGSSVSASKVRGPAVLRCRHLSAQARPLDMDLHASMTMDEQSLERGVVMTEASATERFTLTGEDRIRMQRLFEGAVARIQQMSLIMNKLGATDSSQAKAGLIVKMDVTPGSMTGVLCITDVYGCGCYDYNTNECYSC
jgi:hypothetical protein